MEQHEHHEDQGQGEDRCCQGKGHSQGRGHCGRHGHAEDASIASPGAPEAQARPTHEGHCCQKRD